MLNGLETLLAEMKKRGEKALIPFLMAGDPDLNFTEKALNVLAQNGADVIEIGIPFSDPLADGPVLQAAATRSIQAGTTLDGIFPMLERFRSRYKTPLVLLVYYNIIVRRGLDTFCRQAAKVGVNGLVIPDLPYEEAAVLEEAATAHGLVNVRFISPTTSAKRMEQICSAAKGFIYCVSVTGVTGGSKELPPETAILMKKVRSFTETPLALGFGVSVPAQAAAAVNVADAVIVGTALASCLGSEAAEEEKLMAAAEFLKSFKSAIGG